ncbi:MAG: glycosyltransferase [Candidatus Aenigmarchaeota archaeon]|nr:glycosyltransferase [Candidatus Aenigmarchaeota archaeon]
MELPRVSIIIPAYNEEKTISKCLSSIKKLCYPKSKLETIVIDDGSIDNTAKVVSKFDVNLIKGGHKGVGIARNLGIKKSKGEIIVFVDADEVMNKVFLREIVDPYKDKSVVGVDCSYKLFNTESKIARLHFLRIFLGMKEPGSPYPRSCRKKTIKEIGEIRPRFGYYDDWDFKVRISEKGEILRVEDAVLKRIEPKNMKETWRQNKWAGKSILKLFKEYKLETLRRLLFPLLCAPVPIHFLFLFGPLFFKIIGILGLSFFFIIETKRSIGMYKMTKWKEAFLTPLFDIITMEMYCIGILLGILDWSSTPKA